MRNHSDRDCLQYILLATMVLIVGSALTGCRISSIAASATDVSATDVSATASATGTLPSRPTGTIAGDVVAGPTCPVEQVENPCPPAVVKNREVDIQTHAGTTVATTMTDANGRFRVAVPPGSYVVRVKIVQGQVGMRQITPGDVTVIANQTSIVHIELDTSIR